MDVIGVNSKEYEVAILLATYNSSWNKLSATIKSILLQKDVCFEIIIADDGSKDFLDDKIKSLFQLYDFDDYKIIKSKTNNGTVRNLYNGLRFVSSKYIKPISPGDFFYDEYTLKNWIYFMNTNDCDLSFGDAIYYSIKDSIIHIYSKKNSPINKKLFGFNQNRKKTFINYLLDNDFILGASIFVKTSIFKEYMNKIVNHVIYAEDFMIRLMIFDGKTILYYQQITIWYDYGIGISTTNKSVWENRISQDFDSSNELILSSSKPKDRISKKYLKFLGKKVRSQKLKKVYKFVLFPNLIYWKIRNRLFYEKTVDEFDDRFINLLVDIHQ